MGISSVANTIVLNRNYKTYTIKNVYKYRRYTI